MDHRQHFYDRYTSAQSRFTSLDDVRTRVADEHRGFRSTIDRFLPTESTTRVLDLGCGYGAFLLYAASKGLTNCRGIDLSPEQVDLAHRLGATNAEVADLFTVLAQESGVGLITMFDVIEHLTRAEAITALEKIHGTLGDGGILIMRTPNIDARLGTVFSFGDLTHEMHLNKYAVLELFASLPFRSVEILPVPPQGGGAPAEILRAVLRPLLAIGDRCVRLVQGISSSATISTPNMLIVARR